MRNFRLRRPVLGTGVVCAVLVAVSCGSTGESADESGADFRKITSVPKIFTIDDFVAAGFKKSKQYDVEGLPEARDAWIGFWGPSASERKDYELRFYDTHDSAREVGASLADEATGEELRQRRDSQTWTEGRKDRWRSGNVTAGSTVGTTGPGPIYGDFAIFGNVVLLCEGANTAQSLERCEALVRALHEATSE